jgi:hypothetical protein
MKIAILISGEYRTFDIAKKSMGFLYDDRIDVYFSTWDRTHHQNLNRTLKLILDEEVTLDRVKNSLGTKQLAGYCYESSTMFNKVPTRYNSKMIHRWKRGLDLIKYSGFDYDAILMIRPDIYYHEPTVQINLIIDIVKNIKSNVLYSGWPEGNKTQDDTVLLGSPALIYSAIDGIDIDKWNIASQFEWHNWFWDELTDRNIVRSQITPHLKYDFCRPNVTDEDDTFEKIGIKSSIWRFAQIEQQIIDYGIERVNEFWWPGIVDELEAFWLVHERPPVKSDVS